MTLSNIPEIKKLLHELENEALNDPNRYFGFGMLYAIKKIREILYAGK